MTHHGFHVVICTSILAMKAIRSSVVIDRSFSPGFEATQRHMLTKTIDACGATSR